MHTTTATTHRAARNGRRSRGHRLAWELPCSCGHVERYTSVHDLPWARAAMRAHLQNARDAAGTRY